MSERISTDDDERRRAAYLAEVLTALYPARSGGTPIEYIAVPDIRRPRVLVPSASRRLAATALRHYARPASRSARWKRDAAVSAIVTGVDRLLLPDRLTVAAGPGCGDVNGYLRAALGTDVHLCIHIGPARANRKPVLQLLNCEATTVGFAKLGVNGLTRRLVGAETAALRELARADLRRVRVPAVLHAGTWRDNTVLVQEALPGWRRPTPPGRDRLAAAMREFAECRGVRRSTLGASRYHERLRSRLDALTARTDSDATALLDAGSRLLSRHADRELAFGSWHGDWTPWNMAVFPDEILLWDLERFTEDVPMGFDALHYRLQRDMVTAGGDPATAVAAVLAEAPHLLRHFDVEEAAARVSALLYLVDLAVRYLTDRQAEAGAALGALGRWLLPTLLRHVAAEGGVVL
ncbi:hypothetical protein LX16_3348 [Stackebrandtia albiflava]|uniref:Phosphotransferase family enzyme n=1 Tax=Stackebrandtia albiflava TaxID=406432 RepID=A0A562V443_9ACTN|nr:fructosamine kinase family protein [Stackebrandtia albiflava]TWJ12587.1 hypothetical protein LX16_3348 [Stackebrandtia albiflava]